MKKFGLTLAEILVSLAIVGVVSALTVPQLSSGVQQKHWASALSSQITNFENAMKDIKTKESIIDITESSVWQQSTKEGFKSSFLENMTNVEAVIDKNFSGYYNNNGIFDIKRNTYNGDVEDSDEYIIYKLKNKGTLFISPLLNDFVDITEDTALERGLDYSKIVGIVIIDINGENMPNTVGRDIFYFNLNENGVLKAYGSMEYSMFWLGRVDEHWSKKCNDDNKGSGIHCTGRLVENNFVMDY